MVKYERDGIVLHHADCRDVLPTIEDGSVDLVLTDPPYGIGVTKMRLGSGQRILPRGDGEWDKEAPDLGKILDMGLPSIVWGGNYFELPPSRCWLVWDKNTHKTSYADCELAWTNLDSVVRKFFESWVGAGARDNRSVDRVHPTQKPVALMLWCIGLVSDVKTVLDPYAGSATTAIACLRSGKKFIGCEIEKVYFDIACERIDKELDAGCFVFEEKKSAIVEQPQFDLDVQ